MPIQIVSKKDGFRRCGIPHSSSPTIYADGHFNKEEIKILTSEPMLVVTEVDKEEEAEVDNEVDDKKTNLDINFSDLDYNELRSLAKKEGIKASGSKKDLIKRLRGAK